LNPPVVKQQMLIRKPIAAVFNAFIDPALTTKFWFTKSSGKVEAGKQLHWEWEMYGISVDVIVKTVKVPQLILIEWDNPPMPVEWQFTPYLSNATLVQISTSGFRGTDDETVSQALDSMGGFSFLLAAAKAFLEHDVRLNLVADHHPEAQKP